jgi:hypothetical protein
VSLTFSLVLTVSGPGSSAAHDVLIRGTADQTVAELSHRLALYLGLPSSDSVRYGLRVERTGEHLRPDAGLSSVDLLEGDLVQLLPGRQSNRRRPTWADDDSPAGTMIPLRPRP